MNSTWSRNAFVYLLIVVAGAALFFNISGSAGAPAYMSLSQVAKDIQAGSVTSISVQDENVQVELAGETQIFSVLKEREFGWPGCDGRSIEHGQVCE